MNSAPKARPDPLIRQRVEVVPIQAFDLNIAMGPDGPAVVLVVNGGQFAGALSEALARQLGAELSGAGAVARLKEQELRGLLAMHSPIVEVKPPPLIVAK